MAQAQVTEAKPQDEVAPSAVPSDAPTAAPEAPAPESAGASGPSGAPSAAGSSQPPVTVHEAALPEAADRPGKVPGGQIDILLDATVPISARLGTVEVQVRHLLQLGPGSVLKMDTRVGEPVELFLRGIKFATGTLVVVGDRLGVRVRELLPPEQVEGTRSA